MIFKTAFFPLLFGLASGSWAAGTWTILASGTTQPLLSIACPTSSTCYTVGNSGLLLRTSNGGDSWTPANAGIPGPSSLSDVSFLDSLRGYIVGGGLYRTTDGAGTWIKQVAPGSVNTPYHWNAISLRSPDVIRMVGSLTQVFGTTTGVHSFKMVYSCAVKFDGSQSTVGGSLRAYEDGVGGPEASSLFYASETNGYATLEGDILRTLTGGSSWEMSLAGQAQQATYFVNMGLGYSVGDSGRIYKTTTGGTAWSGQTSGTARNLRAVYFADANTGYAVGDSGLVLETSNGGGSWVVCPALTAARLNKIVLAGNGSTGYAVGDGGVILKLTGGTPSAITPRRTLDPRAGFRRIGNRWYGFSMPDGRAFDAQGRQAPVQANP